MDSPIAIVLLRNFPQGLMILNICSVINSVITTINVYELEGVTEIAKRLTGIEVKETVPSDTLDLADEVRLIDISPETILNRFAEGELKGNSDSSVFKRGNLGVLRELALRIVAEDVNVSLDKYREEIGLSGPSGVMERILVSAQYHWNGSMSAEVSKLPSA